MNADAVASLAVATLEGSLPFPRIVGELVAQGVEYYHVDYVSKSFTFYGDGGAVVSAALLFEGLPPVSREWNGVALKLRIGYGKQGYTVTRTVGGSDVHGTAWMERCGMDEIHFFRARYDTRPVTEVSCSLGMDGDNYYRATCKTWQADRRGLEAWFQHP